MQRSTMLSVMRRNLECKIIGFLLLKFAQNHTEVIPEGVEIRASVILVPKIVFIFDEIEMLDGKQQQWKRSNFFHQLKFLEEKPSKTIFQIIWKNSIKDQGTCRHDKSWKHHEIYKIIKIINESGLITCI